MENNEDHIFVIICGGSFFYIRATFPGNIDLIECARRKRLLRVV
jgi:hypothetical protein